MNTTVLESKLKRHKITYSNENGTIIIGKPQADYFTLIGLIILPGLIAIGVAIFMFIINPHIIGGHSFKVITGITLLFGMSSFNYSRMKNKKKTNKHLKQLDPKMITITNDSASTSFNAKNIQDFSFISQQINDDTYEGKLYLVDTEGKQHLILGFDDENEKYVLNDLKWFSGYFKDHVELPSTMN